MANRFETYSFRKLVYHYTSRLPSIAPGSVGCSYDHDTLDLPPISLVEAMAQHDRVCNSAYQSWTFPVDLSSSRSPFYYTREDTYNAGGDLKTYDTGRVTFFTEGLETDATAGLIEVEYIVDFFTPQLNEPFRSFGTAQATEGIDNNNLVGTNFAAVGEALQTLPVKPATNLANYLEFTRPFEGLLNVFANNVSAQNLFDSPLSAIILKGPNSGESAAAPTLVGLQSVFDGLKKMKSSKITASVGDILRFWSPGSGTAGGLVDYDFARASFGSLA